MWGALLSRFGCDAVKLMQGNVGEPKDPRSTAVQLSMQVSECRDRDPREAVEVYSVHFFLTIGHSLCLVFQAVDKR